LECALEAEQAEVMRVLLAAGADPDVRSELVEGSLLAAAVRAGREDAVRILVEFGARRDVLDAELHHLVCSGPQPLLLAVVLELGAAVNGRGCTGPQLTATRRPRGGCSAPGPTRRRAPRPG
jgi:hypothetical protein